MIIMDPDKVKQLRRRARRRRYREPKAPIKAERELRGALNAVWARYLFPATEELKAMVQRGATPAEFAAFIDRILDRIEFDYGFHAGDIVAKWRLSVDESTRTAFNREAAHTLNVDALSIYDQPHIQDALAFASLEASQLIKTIPEKYLSEVAKAVADNFYGVPLPAGRNLLQQIQHIGSVSKNRAKLIARDQTAKLNGALQQARQKAIGVDKYIWRTVRDKAVVGNPTGLYPVGSKHHANHYAMEGKMCRWDDPTVYSVDEGKTWLKRTGEMPKNHPKQDIQCRCHAEPVLDIEQILANVQVG